MLKPTPGRCIFCGGASGRSMSKEHVFPDWLRQLFPRSPNSTHVHGAIIWDDDTLTPNTMKTRKQGHVSTKKVRVVCEGCNNGWLSALEERTKPLLSYLIMGKFCWLGQDEQLLLATWVAKTVMTAEFLRRDKVAIPSTDREWIMGNLSPPSSGWWMWIAGSQGVNWQIGINHFSSHISIAPVRPPESDITNMQCTTMAVGRMLVQCISTTFVDVDFALAMPDSSDFKPIWPFTIPVLLWPPSRFLTDEQIESVAENLVRTYAQRRGS